jgi:hypothetical protein
VDANLLVASALYRQLTGNAPRAVAFATTAALLPAMSDIRPDQLLSQQPQLAGDGRETKIEQARLTPLVEAVATAGK